MNYCYSNDGLAWRNVDPDYVAQAGEVLFSAEPSSSQLAAAFPGYASAISIQQAAEQYDSAIKAGLAITSTGTPAISRTYGTLPQDQINLIALQTAINAGQAVPSTLTDSKGTTRGLTSTQVAAICAAVFAYVAAADDTRDTLESGGSEPWPPATKTIA